MGSRVGGSRLSPWTERRILAILLCYPNAKCSSCQTAPSCHCVKQSCSLSLAPLHRCPPCLFSKRRFALVLFFLSVCCCPPSLCSFLSFPPNLPGSTFFFDLVLFITVLCFHRLPLFYFLFPPLSPHARFHSRPLAGVWHHSLCLLSLKGNWKRTKVIKSTIQSTYADWKKTDGTVRWVSSSESLMRATFVQCKSCSLKSVNLEKRLFAVHRENTDIHLFHCPAGIHTMKVSPLPFFSFYWAVFHTEMPNILSSFQRYWLNKPSYVIILKCCFL